MKFRLTFGLLAIVAGLVFGLSALPGEAYAATPIELSAADERNIQTVLDATKVTLDNIQVQINRNEIQDRASTLAYLENLRVYLLTMRELLGGAPASAGGQDLLVEEPEPIASRPVASRSPQATAEPEAPAAPVATEPSEEGEVAGSAVVTETAPENQQTASVSSSANSKRAFWIILITAIVIAIILALPRKRKELVLQDSPQVSSVPPQTSAAPPQQRPEEPGPVQSA